MPRWRTGDPVPAPRGAISPLPQPGRHSPANARAPRLSWWRVEPWTLLLAPRVNQPSPARRLVTRETDVAISASQAIEGPVITTAAAPGWISWAISGPPRPFRRRRQGRGNSGNSGRFYTDFIRERVHDRFDRGTGCLRSRPPELSGRAFNFIEEEANPILPAATRNAAT